MVCTLEPDEVPVRLDHWQALVDRARSSTTAPDGATRVEFDDSRHLDEFARLVAAEQRCCAFLSFTITVDAGGVALEVRGRPGDGIVASVGSQVRARRRSTTVAPAARPSNNRATHAQIECHLAVSELADVDERIRVPVDERTPHQSEGQPGHRE